mgnify:CR=1 FL=1
MKNNDTDSIWFHIPVILVKIVRILTKKPSGKPKAIELELWGKLIKVATDPELGRVRLEIITLPILSLNGYIRSYSYTIAILNLASDTRKFLSFFHYDF